MAPAELHISSLIVHTAPDGVEPVGRAIAVLPGAQVHGSAAGGKLVVTLEADSAAAMDAALACVQRLDGVLSAALVYQCADSLDAMNEEVPEC